MIGGVGAAEPVSDGRSARLAFELWHRLGGADGFPRSVEDGVALHLPIAIHDLPGLSCARVAAWAAANGLPAMADTADRPLRGCLLVRRGRAFLLLDPRDPPDERRLTIAHELGHFLVEIERPRARAARALGAGGTAILDGDRPATLAERLAAVLADVTLAPADHLMARETDGSIGCPRVAAAECAADAFALELLAPRAALRDDVLALAGVPRGQRWALVVDLLRGRYGLPGIAAGGYARGLVADLTGGASMAEWLRTK